MSKIRILFVSANAPGDRPLDIEKEQKLVQQSVGLAKYRDDLEVVHAPAIRPEDLPNTLSNTAPAIVHFSGHGSAAGVIFRDSPIPISGVRLATALQNRQIALVVLNACFSLEQAKEVSAVVKSVVGTTREVADEDALRFAAAFYRAIGDGQTVGSAFRDAKDAVALTGEEDIFQMLGDRDHTFTGHARLGRRRWVKVSIFISLSFLVILAVGRTLLPRADEPLSASHAAASTEPLPAPVVLSGLSAAEKLLVQAAATSIFQAAQALPVIVNDEFANNDYRWPIGQTIYNGGVKCTTTIEDKAFIIKAFSVEGPAYCLAGLDKTAREFSLSVNLNVSTQVATDVEIKYRWVDDANYCSLKYNSRTQLIWAECTENGQRRSIIDSAYVSDIKKSEPNEVTLLVVGQSHVIYFNKKLSAIFSTARSGQGQVRFSVLVQEAHSQANLSISRLILRGTQ